MLAVLMSGMSADDDAMLPGQRDGVASLERAARMKAAGHICGSDERNDGRVVPRAFAQIAVEIDFHHLSTQRHFVGWVEALRNPPSSSTGGFRKASTHL
jgi:hypothetical protein